MKNLDLNAMGVVEMDGKEIKENNGGFFPIVIFGVVIAAEYVAGAFLVGVGVGAAVAASEDHDN